MAATLTYGLNGLTAQQVHAARERFGANEVIGKKHSLLDYSKDVLKEPMVILLLVAALLYFVSGETGDGIFMTCAVFLVVSISLYQESRSRNALRSLKSLTQRTCKVIREGEIKEVNREEIVVGDFVMIEEGLTVPADGLIIQSNDFSLNESILTGESLPVNKGRGTSRDPKGADEVFQGTTVVAGLAIIEVTAVGDKTALGRIGKSLDSIHDEKTPLQLQINNFVRKMAFAGIIVFLI